MHDGTIEQGDTWLKTYMDEYIQWAKKNNSLCIITFDEDNSGSGGNRIFTCLIGQMVAGGSYNNRVTHYNVLRTIEDMHGLPLCGNSSTAPAIDFLWKKNVNTDLSKTGLPINHLSMWFASEKGQLVINAAEINSNKEALISINDLSGRLIRKENISIHNGENIFDIQDLEKGIYLGVNRLSPTNLQGFLELPENLEGLQKKIRKRSGFFFVYYFIVAACPCRSSSR